MAILIVWMFLDLGRPPVSTLGLPMLLSIISVALWMARSPKQMGTTAPWWFVMLAGMALMVPFATNNYTAYYSTRVTAILFLSYCLPLQSLLRRVEDARVWVYGFIVCAAYVGVWATFHNGLGPSGSGGGQDENYTAVIVTMGFPFAYFLMTVDKRRVAKILLTTAMIFFVGAIGMAFNPSRGGFLALCAVAGYIVVRSPKRKQALGVLAIAGTALAMIAGPAFWEEIRTSTDTSINSTGGMRLQAWAAGVRMFLAHPLFGVGPGNFPWQLANFETAEDIARLGRSQGSNLAHSLWVELLSDLGLVGVVCTLVLVWGSWSGLSKVVRRCNDMLARFPQADEYVKVRAFAYAFQGSILAVAVNGVFLSLLYYSHMWIVIAAGNAMPYVLARVDQQHARQFAVTDPRDGAMASQSRSLLRRVGRR